MKKKEKSRSIQKSAFESEGTRKVKLKPLTKEKYKTRNPAREDDEEGELNLFDFESDQWRIWKVVAKVLATAFFSGVSPRQFISAFRPNPAVKFCAPILPRIKRLSPANRQIFKPYFLGHFKKNTPKFALQKKATSCQNNPNFLKT